MSDKKEVLVEVDSHPQEKATNYLQMADHFPKRDPLKDAYWQIHENITRGRDPTTLHMVGTCLHVMETFDIYRQSQPIEYLDLPVPPAEDALVLMIRLHQRGWNSEILSTFVVPDEAAGTTSYKLTLALRVTAGDATKSKYWGGALEDSAAIQRRFFNGNATLEETERFWTLVDRFDVKIEDIQAANELVGDLSEGLDYISYNEEGIRAAWIEGRLNSEVQWDKENDLFKYHRFLALLGDEVRDDDDYDALLTERIAKINGWPKHYSTDPNELDELTIAERLKILPLQLEVENSRQQALNRYCDLKGELEKRL